MIPSGNVTGPATRLFLFTEIACYFLFSIWWRGQVPPWVGVLLALGHLLGLLALLWLWERWKPGIRLGEPDSGSSDGREPEHPWTPWLFASAGFAVHWRFVTDPVLSGPDEPVMIADHVGQVASFFAPGFLVAAGLVIASGLVLLASLRLVRPAGPGQEGLKELLSRWPWLLLLLLAMVVYGFAESASRINWGLAERWPPLGTVLLLPLHLVGLDDIQALRRISVLFYSGTAYLVFRIVRTEAGAPAALGAAGLLMTAPAFFNWGHYAFREIGGVFFFTLGIHVLQMLLTRRRAEDFALIFAVAALGYLERRPSVLLAVVAGTAILLVFRERLFTWHNLRALALPALAMIWLALPWIAISSNVRVYVLYTAHLAQADTLLSYFAALPGQAGWPLVLLGIAGLFAGLLAARRMAWVVLCWILLLNLLFVMDVTAPRVINRFAIHFLPGLAILAGLALAAPGRRMQTAAVATAIGAGALTLVTWYMDDDRRMPWLPVAGMRYAAEPLYPFDQVAGWLDRRVAELPQGKRLHLYQPAPWQSSLPLYLKRNGNHRVKLREAGRGNFRRNRDLDTAFESCREAGCDYLVVPVNRAGRLILHPGTSLSELEARNIPGIQRFDARHGSVWLVPGIAHNHAPGE
jgi:hypothetical protein